MIDVTIKTLDSRNHAFSVEDDLTVKQFKEHIAEPINIPVESQRLIYCGRVLVDEKKLSEYNVNGKVIHLVQRPPPSVAQSDNNSGESSEPRSTTNRRPWRALFNPGGVRVDTGGNAMYLGAMAFPADLMDAQGITMPNPRHGLSQSRLQVVRSMLRRARNSLQSLENPVHQESPTEYTQAPPAASATNVNFGDVAVLAQAFTHGVTRAAATLNLPTATPVVNVEVGTPNAASGGENSETVGAFGLGPDVETVPDAEPFDINATSASASEETASTTEPGENNNRGGRSRYPTTIFLAGLLHQVMSVNRRLQPFLETYHDLMREDPTLENPAEAQRLFNQVSEILHFMSHAYHAISDVMCDFSQPPPRLLQCRPVLIQHSAVLQTGIPIQLNLGGSRSASNNNASTTASTGSTSTIPEEPAAEATTANSAEQPERESPESTNSTGSTTGERRRERRMWQSLSPTQTGARGVQISPSNLEIFMDVGQGSITFDSVEATVVSGNGSPPPSGENGADFPNPDFMSFVQALGHVRQALGALGSRQSPGTATSSQSGSATSSTTSPSSTQPSSDRSRSFAPGATSIPTSSTAGSGGSQPAWPNSGTQPTTSTQTRSSSSHVHISPGFQGMGVPGFFDPFLPCNSHHIRGSRRRPQQTQSDVDTTSSSGIPTFTATIQAHVEPRGGDRAPGGREAARNASSGSASSGTGLDSEDISRGTGGATNNGNERDSSTTSSRRNWVLNQISRMLGDRGEGESVVRRIRSEPNDVTVVVQASAQLPRDLSPETPLLPLIQESRYPDSIFTDIFLRMARHLTVRDVRDLNFDHLLTTVRPALRRYIRFEFLRDRDSNLAISEGINRLNVDIRPIFESVLASLFDIPMREDVDIVATFNQLNHSSLPRIIRDILESDDSSEFIRNITQHWIEYTQNLASLFCFTCLNGDRDAKCAFIRLGIRFMSQIPGIENWDEFRIPYMVRQFATRLAPTSDSVREFIVFRMGGAPSVPGAGGAAAAAAVPQPPTAAAVAVHDQSPSSPPVVAPVQPPAVALSIEIAAPNVVTPQQPPQLVPMEIEDTEVAETVPTAEQISEPLPDVIIGAEQWHNQVPSDWVPIITRDRDRQRRQAAQSPLSDAYLSGMPNKRRKIVSSAKPHGSISKILTDTVTTALATAGVNNTEGVAEAAGVDAALRTAHKEQLKATVSATLRSHPDFTPEKYPNAAKFIAP